MEAKLKKESREVLKEKTRQVKLKEWSRRGGGAKLKEESREGKLKESREGKLKESREAKLKEESRKVKL